MTASAADEQHFLLVSTREGRDILRYNRDTGAFVDTLVSAGSGGLGVPFGMDIGSDGNLYVASTMTEAAYDSRILKYDIRTGAFLGVFADFHPDMSGPLGVTVGPGGDLYVADRSTDPATPGQVLRFNGATGTYLGDFTHGTATLSIPPASPSAPTTFSTCPTFGAA